MAKIIGGTATSSMLVPDWNQTNPNRADYIKNKPEVANAIKGTAIGNVVRIDDFSPVPHEVKIEGVGVALVSEREGINGNPLAYEKYTITAISSEATGESVNYLSAGEDGYAELDDGVAGVGGVFAVGIAVGDTVFYNGTTFLKGGGTVTACGKNLLPKLKTGTTTQNGVTFTAREDGSIVLNGTPTQSFAFSISSRAAKFIPAGTTVTISSEGTQGQSWNGYILNGFLESSISGKRVQIVDNHPHDKTKVTPEGFSGLYLIISIYPTNGEIKDVVFRPMLEIGNTPTAYETYKEPTTHTADENGKVQGITANGEAMTLIAESGTTITAEYNKDTNKVIESLVNAIISLGGNV